MNKTLGQIAHEARGDLYAGAMKFATPIPWEKMTPRNKDECERMAGAVRDHLVSEKQMPEYSVIGFVTQGVLTDKRVDATSRPAYFKDSK